MAVLVPRIVVSRRDLDAAESYAVYEACLVFLRSTSGKGCYREDEFPPELAMLDSLDTYLGQVSNGGHEQYVSNSGWNEDLNVSVHRFLLMIGAAEFASLFKRFATYVAATPQVMQGMKRRGGFETAGDKIDEWAGGFDDEFFRLKKQTDIYRITSDFFKGSGLLEVVDHRHYQSRIDQIVASNPHRATRQAEIQLSMERSRIWYQRKLNACEMLGELISDRFDPSSGFIRRMMIDGTDREVTTHKAQSGREVVYLEDEKRCRLLSFPEGLVLAELDLNMLEH